MFRIVRKKATIVHLCIDCGARKKGYAHALLDWLIREVNHCYAIKLKCRADFEANQMWSRFGFYPINRMPGKAGELVLWWLSLDHRDLFTEEKRSGAIEAVFDANVFIDIVKNPSKEKLPLLLKGEKEETIGLLAEWLVPSLTLCYTGELLTDLSRNSKQEDWLRMKAELDRFKMLECAPANFDDALKKLTPLFGSVSSPQDESDLRHLARAIAAEADVFVTRDRRLLKLGEKISDNFELAILSPGELCTVVDAAQQSHLYKRSQVAGTSKILKNRTKTAGEDLVSAIRLGQERHRDVRKTLEDYLNHRARLRS
jgi:predicted nucleic acid-binding protein